MGAGIKIKMLTSTITNFTFKSMYKTNELIHLQSLRLSPYVAKAPRPGGPTIDKVEVRYRLECLYIIH